jgi:molybdopterin-guanine dinucleotide biosynthesis protein A
MMVREMRPHADAAIIAGGRARRFGGRDKSRLLVQGRPIINRQIEILQQLAATVFIVAPDAARFADLGIPVHADLIPEAGALGGIYTALASSSAERVIVVACDLPFLHAGLLGRLVDLSGDHDAAWVRTSRGPEPLLACYRQSAREAIRQEIEAGRLKASNLESVLKIAEVGREDVERFGPADRLLANVNTLEEWNRIKG